MKIGISALTHELEDAVLICKNNELIKHIEIGIDNLHECNKILQFKNEFLKYDISIGIHLPMELNTCENIEYIRNSWVEFIRNMEFKLSCINIKYFNMHLGYVIKNRFEYNKKKYLDNTIKFLKTLKCNKNIFIENTYTNGGDLCNIGTTPYEFEYIFSKTNNMKFCYDTGHELISKYDFISNLNNYIEIVHLSDNDGEKDSHIGIGKGKLNLHKLEQIINLNPKFIILEVGYKYINDSIKTLERFI